MKLYSSLFLFFVLFILSCESPHDKNTKLHIINIHNTIAQISEEYQAFRKGELDLKIGKTNLFFNNLMKKVEEVKKERDMVHPSGKYLTMEDALDSVVSLTDIFFQQRKELLLSLDEYITTVDLYLQSKSELEVHEKGAKGSGSFAAHHKHMLAFEKERIKTRGDKLIQLKSDLPSKLKNLKAIQPALQSQYDLVVKENEKLKFIEKKDFILTLFNDSEGAGPFIDTIESASIEDIFDGKILPKK